MRPELIHHARRCSTKLPRGRCSASDMAQTAWHAERTLSRYLKAAGTGFRAVADGVRFEVARRLVVDTDIPLVQISAALALLRTRRVLTRACREMVGGLAQPVAVTTESCLALSCGTYTAIADAGRQKERRLISACTKAALGAAKARGQRLGRNGAERLAPAVPDRSGAASGEAQRRSSRRSGPRGRYRFARSRRG